MNNLKRTLAVSASVDDRRPLVPGIGAEEAALTADHRRLDSMLRATQPGAIAPPADLQDRILAALEVTPHRRETVLATFLRSPARVASLAAACVALLAGTWLALPLLRPTVDHLAANSIGHSGLDPSLVFGLPERSEPAIRDTIDRSFEREAASLRSDTVRAADMVLAHLPLGRR